MILSGIHAEYRPLRQGLTGAVRKPQAYEDPVDGDKHSNIEEGKSEEGEQLSDMDIE